MQKKLNCEDFLEQSINHLIIDVRSPSEYNKAHIQNAQNIPLFDDIERAKVGTIYKKEGRQPAILKGLDIVAPKMGTIIKKVQSLSNSNKVFVYCWRGGLRSGSISWLLSLYGFEVYTLIDGYKAYRNFVLQFLNEADLNLRIVGGRTGSGKTEILNHLKLKGKQIIDLEKIAHHKGSAFGMIGEQPQPSQEEFENRLFHEIKNLDCSTKIYVEDESRKIGKCVLPEKFWNAIRNNKVYFIDLTLSERIKLLNKQYGSLNKDDLCSSVLSIQKRLGPNETKTILSHIENNEMEKAIGMCLRYYDKTYEFGLSKRNPQLVEKIKANKFDIELLANRIIENE